MATGSFPFNQFNSDEAVPLLFFSFSDVQPKYLFYVRSKRTTDETLKVFFSFVRENYKNDNFQRKS